LPSQATLPVYQTLATLREQRFTLVTIAHPHQIPKQVIDAARPRLLQLTDGGFQDVTAIPKHLDGLRRDANTFVKPLPRWEATFSFGPAFPESKTVRPGTILTVVGPPSEEFAKLQDAFSQPRGELLQVASLTAGLIPTIKYAYLPDRLRFRRLAPRLPMEDNAIIDRWYDRRILSFCSVLRKLVALFHLEPILSTGKVDLPPASEAEPASPALLSGGNQQRFVLARALLGLPDLLVCVDPFSGLDNAGVLLTCEMFRRHTCAGRAIVILSTNPAGAEAACADEVVELGSPARAGGSTVAPQAAPDPTGAP
jgi:hypothetical protein